MARSSGSKGFTLIELLIVIGIIGFLAAAVLVAVDPVRRIQDSRDARRYSEVNAILNAILTKQVDDRLLYNGMATAPIINQSGTQVQVIVSSDTGTDCSVAATAPACPTRTLAATAKNCVANLSGTGSGSGTITSSTNTLTGSSTAFTTQVSVGDTITSGTSTCTVQTITSATAITCTGTVTPTIAAPAAYTITRAASALFPTYIASIPTDPAGTGTAGNLAIGSTNSGYYIQRTTGNRIEIGACYPEQAAAISVKR